MQIDPYINCICKSIVYTCWIHLNKHNLKAWNSLYIASNPHKNLVGSPSTSLRITLELFFLA